MPEIDVLGAPISEALADATNAQLATLVTRLNALLTFPNASPAAIVTALESITVASEKLHVSAIDNAATFPLIGLDTGVGAIAPTTVVANGRFVVVDMGGGVYRLKVGNGVTQYSVLPFITAGGGGGGTATWGTLSLPASIAAISALIPAADRFAYFTSSTTAALATLTPLARIFLAGATYEEFHTALGLDDTVPPGVLAAIDDKLSIAYNDADGNPVDWADPTIAGSTLTAMPGARPAAVPTPSVPFPPVTENDYLLGAGGLLTYTPVATEVAARRFRDIVHAGGDLEIDGALGINQSITIGGDTQVIGLKRATHDRYTVHLLPAAAGAPHNISFTSAVQAPSVLPGGASPIVVSSVQELVFDIYERTDATGGRAVVIRALDRLGVSVLVQPGVANLVITPDVGSSGTNFVSSYALTGNPAPIDPTNLTFVWKQNGFVVTGQTTKTFSAASEGALELTLTATTSQGTDSAVATARSGRLQPRWLGTSTQSNTGGSPANFELILPSGTLAGEKLVMTVVQQTGSQIAFPAGFAFHAQVNRLDSAENNNYATAVAQYIVLDRDVTAGKVVNASLVPLVFNLAANSQFQLHRIADLDTIVGSPTTDRTRVQMANSVDLNRAAGTYETCLILCLVSGGNYDVKLKVATMPDFTPGAVVSGYTGTAKKGMRAFWMPIGQGPLAARTITLGGIADQSATAWTLRLLGSSTRKMVDMLAQDDKPLFSESGHSLRGIDPVSVPSFVLSGLVTIEAAEYRQAIILGTPPAGWAWRLILPSGKILVAASGPATITLGSLAVARVPDLIAFLKSDEGNVSASRAARLTWPEGASPDPPRVVATQPAISVNVGGTIAVDVAALFEGAVSYSATVDNDPLPGGWSLNATTGALTGSTDAPSQQTVVVYGHNAAGRAETQFVVSVLGIPIAQGTAATFTGANALVGTTWTITPGTWTGGHAPFADDFQFLRNGISLGWGAALTYVILAADQGSTITAQVRRTDRFGQVLVRQPSGSAVVAAGGGARPTVSGSIPDVSATIGDTVTVATAQAFADETGYIASFVDGPLTAGWSIVAGTGVITVPTTDELVAKVVLVSGTNANGTSEPVEFRVTIASAALTNPTPFVFSGPNTNVGTVWTVGGGVFAGGVDPKEVTYRFRRNGGGISVEFTPQNTYTIQAGDAGATITVRVRGTDSSLVVKTLTVDANGSAVVPAAGAVPAVVAEIADVDVSIGGANTVATAQAFTGETGFRAAFSPATPFTTGWSINATTGVITFPTTAAFATRTVRVIASNANGDSAPVDFDIIVRAPALANVTPPSFVGFDVNVGTVWNINDGTWTGGVGAQTSRYRVFRNGIGLGTGFTTTASYTIVAADAGSTLTAQVQRTDSSAPPQVVVANATGSAVVPLVNATPPAVVGDIADVAATVGDAVTREAAGAFSGSSITYSISSVPGVSINSATGRITVQTDVELALTEVTVTASNGNLPDATVVFNVSVTAAELTNPVPWTFSGPDTLVGTAWAVTGGIFAGGVNPKTVTFRFRRNGIFIGPATASNEYVLQPGDAGATITCRVRCEDSSLVPKVLTPDAVGSAVVTTTTGVPSVVADIPDVDVLIGGTNTVATAQAFSGETSFAAAFDTGPFTAGWSIDTTTGVVTFPVGVELAATTVRVTASNATGPSLPVDFVVTVRASVLVNSVAPALTVPNVNVGTQLSVSDGTWTGGVAPQTTTFRYFRNGTGMGTGFSATRTYTLTAADRGSSITAQVRRTDSSLTPQIVTVTATGSAVVPAADGAPTVIGTIANVDALIGDTVTRNCAEAFGGVGNSYTVAPATPGVSIVAGTGVLTVSTTAEIASTTLTVTAANGTLPNASTSFTVAVTSQPLTNPTMWTFTGANTNVGTVWTVAGGVFAGGVTPRTVNFRFRRAGVDLVAFSPTATYTIVAADQGTTITAHVRAVDKPLVPKTLIVGVSGSAVVPSATSVPTIVAAIADVSVPVGGTPTIPTAQAFAGETSFAAAFINPGGGTIDADRTVSTSAQLEAAMIDLAPLTGNRVILCRPGDYGVLEIARAIRNELHKAGWAWVNYPGGQGGQRRYQLNSNFVTIVAEDRSCRFLNAPLNLENVWGYIFDGWQFESTQTRTGGHPALSAIGIEGMDLRNFYVRNSKFKNLHQGLRLLQRAWNAGPYGHNKFTVQPAPAGQIGDGTGFNLEVSNCEFEGMCGNAIYTASDVIVRQRFLNNYIHTWRADPGLTIAGPPTAKPAAICTQGKWNEEWYVRQNFIVGPNVDMEFRGIHLRNRWSGAAYGFENTISEHGPEIYIEDNIVLQRGGLGIVIEATNDAFIRRNRVRSIGGGTPPGIVLDPQIDRTAINDNIMGRAIVG